MPLKQYLQTKHHSTNSQFHVLIHLPDQFAISCLTSHGSNYQSTPNSPDRLNPRAGLLIRRRMANHMNLSHMTLGDKVVRLLAQALGDLPDVESLDLSDNNITDASVVPLLAIAMEQSSTTGLSPFASLRQLDLSDNSLGTPSALALAAYLGQQVISTISPTPLAFPSLLSTLLLTLPSYLCV